VPNSNLTLPTRSRRQGDSDLLTRAVENGPRVAGDDGAAWLMSGDGEGGVSAPGTASEVAAVTGGPSPSSSSAQGTLDLVVRRRGLCGNSG
jgi:hypothetical protein